ncbi:MAG: hypothetical protein JXM70_07010 [Pirellulales bacterium]|nr:hypothetical protein [Pirellulales bacterium]
MAHISKHVLNSTVKISSFTFATCGLLVLVVALSGCGDSGPVKYPVSGVVSYNGQPLPTGNVMFVPEEGGPPAVCAIGADGSYSFEAIAGRHRVGVTAIPEPPPGANEMNYRAPKPLVPPKFGRPDTSGISVEVQEDKENNIDIKLP